MLGIRKALWKNFSAPVLVLILCLLSLQSFAQVVVQKEVQKDKDNSPLEQDLIDSNVEFARMLNHTADGFDVFITGKRLTKRKNDSRLTLSLDSYLDHTGKITTSPGVGFNLHLPNVESYFNLKFTSYDETTTRGIKKIEPIKENRPQNYGATLGFFRKLNRVKVSFQPRVDYQKGVRISHALGFESSGEFKKLTVAPKVEFFANADRGTGVFHALNFGLPLNKIFSLSQINQAEYYDRDTLYEVNHGLSLSQVIPPNAGLGYTVVLNFNNKSAYHLQAYTFTIGWGQTIYKDILNYRIGPNLSFNKDRGFSGAPGLAAGVDLIF